MLVSILGGVGVMAVLIEVGDAVKRRLLGPGHGREARGPHTVIGRGTAPRQATGCRAADPTGK